MPSTDSHQIWDITELLMTIGRVLDRNSLNAMTRINKFFHTLFSLLLYNTLTLELKGQRQRLPSLRALRNNAIHIHHLAIAFPTNLDHLDALADCPNL
ncbi:hypothetical protein BG015_001063, partial [Linnemannia schmuckeri]